MNIEAQVPFKIALDLALAKRVGPIVQPSETVATRREAAYQADFVARRREIIAKTVANNMGK